MSRQEEAEIRGDSALTAINGMLMWGLATVSFRECEPSRHLVSKNNPLLNEAYLDRANAFVLCSLLGEAMHQRGSSR